MRRRNKILNIDKNKNYEIRNIDKNKNYKIRKIKLEF